MLRITKDGKPVEFADLPAEIQTAIDFDRSRGFFTKRYTTGGAASACYVWQVGTDATGRGPLTSEVIETVGLARRRLFELWGVLLGVGGCTAEPGADLEAIRDCCDSLAMALEDAKQCGRAVETPFPIRKPNKLHLAFPLKESVHRR